MRKFNSILTAVILVLFIIHGILGALNMLDVVVVITKVMAWVMVALIAVHVVLSCILTAKAIKTWKVTGAPYLRENTLFWARRISGIADLIVDRSIMFENLKSIGLWPEKEARHTKRGEEIAYEASRCLQCGCCLEVCPNFIPGEDFYSAASFVPTAPLKIDICFIP